jgi:dienelactone hydrolase
MGWLEMVMPGLIKRPRAIVIHSLFSGIIGLVFGAVGGGLVAWSIGGLVIGAGIGWLTERFVRWINLREERHIRVILVTLIIEALLIVYVGVPAYGAYFTVHPPRTVPNLNPGDIGIDYEDVWLETDDGVPIAAWFVPSNNGAAIVIVHGLSGNRAHVIHHLQALAQHGYGVLAIDMRAHGESGGGKFSGWDSDREVMAAVEYLRKQEGVDQDRIGAIGLSAGANAVLYAAARSEEINAVLVDGTGLGRTEDALGPMLPELRPLFFMTPVNWVHYKMLELISGVKAAPPIKEQVQLIAPRPGMFFAAGLDDLEPAMARRYATLEGEKAEYWVIPGVEHLGGINAHTEEYLDRMLDFFDAHLPEEVEQISKILGTGAMSTS